MVRGAEEPGLALERLRQTDQRRERGSGSGERQKGGRWAIENEGTRKGEGQRVLGVEWQMVEARQALTLLTLESQSTT